MGKLLLSLVLICMLPMVLIYPGWCKADQRKKQGASILFMPLLAMALWGALLFAELSEKSLSNLVEVYGVVAMAVGIAYVKFLLLDRQFKRGGKSAAAAWALLAIAVTAFTLLMPVLPE